MWINGNYLGKRPNGYTSFMYDLTPFIKVGRENVISVRVDHSKHADSRWYTGSGIYRNVYLVEAADVHFDQWGIKYKLRSIDETKAVVEVRSTVKNNSLDRKTVFVNNAIADPKSGRNLVAAKNKVVLAPSSETEVLQIMTLPNPKRWDITNPHLYNLKSSIEMRNVKLDNNVTRIGLRTVEFDANKGFFLNGKNMKLKGVCIHHDAGGFGAAVPREVWRRRLLVLKEIGINAIRLSHNPQSPDVYELCDEIGLMVKDEAFDEWEFPKKKWIAGWNQGQPGFDGSAKFFEEWCERDVEDMVRRDRNHPSVILWSIGNEVDYPNDPYSHPILNGNGIDQQHEAGFQPDRPHADRMSNIALKLIDAVRRQDNSRPVTGALAGPVMSNETEYPGALDVVGYNYTESRYKSDHKKYPDRKFYGSETRHDHEAWKAVRDNDFISGQFIWTGFDYLGESGRWPSRGLTTGMVDFTGFIKPKGFYRQSLWSDTPMAYLGTYKIRGGNSYLSIDAPATWNYDAGDKVRVVCYTNCDEAALFINGKPVGDKKPYDDYVGMISWDLDYQPGRLQVVAYKDGKEIVENSLQSTNAPYAIRAVKLNVPGEKDGDIKHIMVEIVDNEGRYVFNSDNEIICRTEDGTVLYAFENSDPHDMGSHRDHRERVYQGRALAYVKGKKGDKITFSSPWLKSAEIILD